ncbi:MAG: FtsW/RodA/SpoVE family cell cycle protein [Bacteroidales bacterium]|nr:FtsW/RodA/SpoVE family cell cycle protein [Bacteroidales bacterium]
MRKLKLKWQFKGDKIILAIVIFLSLFSLLMVYSTSNMRVLNHLVHLAVCYGLMILCYVVDYRKIAVFTPLLFLFAFVLLLLTILSQAVRGVTIFGHDIQTFYLIGFLVILYITDYIAHKYNAGHELTKEKILYLFGVVAIFSLGMAKLNMSTAIIFFVTCNVIFFVANVNLKYVSLFFGGTVLIAVIAATAVFMYSKSDKSLEIGRMNTVVSRVTYYITKDNTDGYGDQMVLSRAAIARGGFHPSGPGKGVIKYRLPENSTDYAFASVYEELGFVAGVLIIMAYLILFYRARIVSKNSGGPFGKLFSFAIGFWLTCQALVHIGVNCDLLPATGQTLPFISSGGASLAVSGIAVGILLNISKANALREEANTPRTL